MVEIKVDAARFDKIASEVFAPVYPVIAEQIKHKTGIARGTCLDVGSGGGHLGISVAKITDLYVYLFDESLEMLGIATQHITGHGLETRMKTLHGDVCEIPLSDRSIDLVISRGSLHFWEDQQRAFKEIYRVLAPGGAAYIGWGFGTVELKEQITIEMEQRDKNRKWRERADKNLGVKTMETLERVLQRTGISAYETSRDGSGLWIMMRRAG